MSLFDTLIATVASSLTIETDKDAIQTLLKIIEKNNIELDEYDQAVVDFIKSR